MNAVTQAMESAPAPTDAVAVIIPTYNRWPHVGAAIESCLRQSHPSVEVVVVDDASTDGTSRRVAKRYGDRVRLVSLPENVEKSRARNKGIRLTRAEYVCMLDSDDVLHATGISDRLKVFREDPGFDGVAYGSTHYRGKRNDVDHARYPSGNILDAYLADFSILNNNAYLLRRATMLEHGMYRDELTNMEDRELLIRLTARLPFRYCGSVIQTVRRVDNSARSCFLDLVHQGHALTEGLKADAELAALLGPRVRTIEFTERYELARACYKLRRFRAYIRAAENLLGEYPDLVQDSRRIRRRLAVARALKILSAD